MAPLLFSLQQCLFSNDSVPKHRLYWLMCLHHLNNVQFFLKTPLYGAGEFGLNSPTPTLFPLNSSSGVYKMRNKYVALHTFPSTGCTEIRQHLSVSLTCCNLSVKYLFSFTTTLRSIIARSLSDVRRSHSAWNKWIDDSVILAVAGIGKGDSTTGQGGISPELGLKHCMRLLDVEQSKQI